LHEFFGVWIFQKRTHPVLGFLPSTGKKSKISRAGCVFAVFVEYFLFVKLEQKKALIAASLGPVLDIRTVFWNSIPLKALGSSQCLHICSFSAIADSWEWKCEYSHYTEGETKWIWRIQRMKLYLFAEYWEWHKFLIIFLFCAIAECSEWN
jgi:hypothetical protein